MVSKKVVNIKPAISLMSCVGINCEKLPVSFGNYFDFASGERCLNMWAENLKAFVSKECLSTIECTVFSDGTNSLCFVTDKRIPSNWLHGRLCVTGCGWGSVELCIACCEYAGVSTSDDICGCEDLTQSPHISQSCSGETGIWTNHCCHCGRKWKSAEKNN